MLRDQVWSRLRTMINVKFRPELIDRTAFIALLRRFEVPVVFSEHATYPAMADVVGDFVYARLQKGKDTINTGYPPKALDAWAERLLLWSAGGEPDDLPKIDSKVSKKQPRDVAP